MMYICTYGCDYYGAEDGADCQKYIVSLTPSVGVLRMMLQHIVLL